MKLCLTIQAQLAITAVLACGCAVVGTQETARPHQPQRGHVFDGRVTLSGGQYEFDIDGVQPTVPPSKDDTSAGLFALQIEGSTPSGIGGGLALEVVASDDKLFDGQLVEGAQATSVEFAPFFLYRLRAGDRFRMPVRFGPWIHALTLEDRFTSDTIDWATLGLRLAVEPEVVLARSERFEWTIFTALSGALGETTVSLSGSGVNDDGLDSNGRAVGLEIGPRFRWSHFFVGVSYVRRWFSVGQAEGPAVVVSAIDTGFGGLAFTFGGGF